MSELQAILLFLLGFISLIAFLSAVTWSDMRGGPFARFFVDHEQHMIWLLVGFFLGSATVMVAFGHWQRAFEHLLAITYVAFVVPQIRKRAA